MSGAIILEDLNAVLKYDPDSGILTWRTRRSQSVKAGAVAGTINSLGYRMIGIKGKYYCAHRLAWFIYYGEVPASEIDHVNMVKDDNRMCNLRLATRSENLRNIRPPSTNTSGFKGVSAFRNKWKASITLHRERHYLGLFETAKLAHAAYVEAANRLHGEFARTTT